MRGAVRSKAQMREIGTLDDIVDLARYDQTLALGVIDRLPSLRCRRRSRQLCEKTAQIRLDALQITGVRGYIDEHGCPVHKNCADALQS
jgi:hypothetical protein